MLRRSLIGRAVRLPRSVAGRLRRGLREARAAIRYQGVLLFLWEAVQQACRPFWEIEAEIWFVKDLEQVAEPRPLDLDLEVREADEADVPAIVDCVIEEDMPLDPDELPEEIRRRTRLHIDRIRLGGACFIAIVKGEIVHVNWTLYRIASSMLSRMLVLDPTEVVTTDAYTPVRWRGRGIHAVVLNHMLAVAHSRGRDIAYTMTLLWNRSSRKGIVSLGWRRCGSLFYIRSERTGKVRALWIGPDKGPFTLVRMREERLRRRRFYRLRGNRCLVLATFATATDEG